jgi:hypothetical protein
MSNMNIVTDPDGHYRGYRLRELACMRALYPAKRDLGFNRASLDFLIRWYHTTYPDADSATMTALTTMLAPSAGDRTWTNMAVGLGPRPTDTLPEDL